jgi:lysozyme
MANKKAIVGAGAAVALAVYFITPYIQKFEGTRYTPYYDTVHVLTVCTGHTGKDVVANNVYTPAQCTQLTEADLRSAAWGVLKYTPNLQDHTYQLAAAISFSYNVGVGDYAHSSVAKDFKAGRLKQGCADMLKYTQAGGVYSKGLANRRQQEYAICMKGLN